MDSVPAAGAGHALSNLEALHALPQTEDGASGRIPERHGLIEAVEGRFNRGQQAFAAGLVEHLADKVRAGARLPEE